MRTRGELFLATFGILSLELAVIRWVSQQVRVFAYLNNVLLMAAFLGMGLGVALGRRRPGLVRATLPALAVLSLVLALSGKLGIVRIGFPDQSIALFGSFSAVSAAVSALVILGIIAAVIAVFLFAGSIVGRLFAESDALDAYGYDLLGSLAGVIATTIVAALGTPPTVWFALGVAAFLWLSRTWTSLIGAIVVLAAAQISIAGAVFSPYYRIDLDVARWMASAPLRLSVNRDFHQYMHDLSFARIAASPDRQRLALVEYAYRLPFVLTPNRRSALIVGGGTGNDVAAALRAGFGSVVSVDIDPVIIDIGEALHPERPYSDPRVRRS